MRDEAVAVAVAVPVIVAVAVGVSCLSLHVCACECERESRRDGKKQIFRIFFKKERKNFLMTKIKR